MNARLATSSGLRTGKRSIQHTMVLLHSFMKKTQQTPKAELALAPKLQKDREGGSAMKNKYIGSTLQSLLDEVGEEEEFRRLAQKKAYVIAAEQRMAALKMSKSALSKRMGTSRPAIDRLLDSHHTSFIFASLNRATQAWRLVLP